VESLDLNDDGEGVRERDHRGIIDGPFGDDLVSSGGYLPSFDCVLVGVFIATGILDFQILAIDGGSWNRSFLSL
jgi:hypothetical protein